VRQLTCIPYNDPAYIFRIYPQEHCDSDGYPFIWPVISSWVKRYARWMCNECGPAYRQSSYLTVHHLSERKADCRWENLVPLCWVCHGQDHVGLRGRGCVLRKVLECPACKHVSIGYAAYRQHLRGMHPHFHILWSSGRIGWELYPTQRRARNAARAYAKPGETFTIEKRHEACEICARHYQRKLTG
jgi:hypothetical protein